MFVPLFLGHQCLSFILQSVIDSAACNGVWVVLEKFNVSLLVCQILQDRLSSFSSLDSIPFVQQPFYLSLQRPLVSTAFRQSFGTQIYTCLFRYDVRWKRVATPPSFDWLSALICQEHMYQLPTGVMYAMTDDNPALLHDDVDPRKATKLGVFCQPPWRSSNESATALGGRWIFNLLHWAYRTARSRLLSTNAMPPFGSCADLGYSCHRG